MDLHMPMDTTYSAYFIAPLYNVSITADVSNINLGNYNIITNDFIFQNLGKTLYGIEDLYVDIQKPQLGMICTRPVAKYMLFKRIDLYSDNVENFNNNKQIQEQIAKDVVCLLTTMRIVLGGNIQINRCYILSEREYHNFGLSLSTSLDHIDNSLYIENKIYHLDNYILSEENIKVINEYKENISKSNPAMWLPISYFMSYYSTTNLIEKIIKLCTVWETTLLNDRKTELQYCLMVRGSSLLNSNLNLLFKIAYDIRSQLIHTGNISTFNQLHKLVNTSKDDIENLFVFIKKFMEPVTREILKKFISIYIKTNKKLESIAKSIDDDIFTKLSS